MPAGRCDVRLESASKSQHKLTLKSTLCSRDPYLQRTALQFVPSRQCRDRMTAGGRPQGPSLEGGVGAFPRPRGLRWDPYLQRTALQFVPGRQCRDRLTVGASPRQVLPIKTG